VKLHHVSSQFNYGIDTDFIKQLPITSLMLGIIGEKDRSMEKRTDRQRHTDRQGLQSICLF